MATLEPTVKDVCARVAAARRARQAGLLRAADFAARPRLLHGVQAVWRGAHHAELGRGVQDGLRIDHSKGVDVFMAALPDGALRCHRMLGRRTCPVFELRQPVAFGALHTGSPASAQLPSSADLGIKDGAPAR